MATTRIMPLHIGKGRTESQAVSDIIDYVANPQKTDNGKRGGRCDRLPCAPVIQTRRNYPGGSKPAGRGVCHAVHQR